MTETTYLTLSAQGPRNLNGLAELTEVEAWGLAQLFKRLSWAEIRACSVDDAEAYEIRDAVAKGQRLLAEAGINPR